MTPMDLQITVVHQLDAPWCLLVLAAGFGFVAGLVLGRLLTAR